MNTIGSTLSNPAQAEKVFSRVSPWLMSVIHPLGVYVVLPTYFGRIEVTGQQYIPTEGAVILAPTHRSRWDPLLASYAAGRHISGRDLRFMVTATETTGFQGWFVRRLGGFPVDLRKPGISSLRHGIELLLDGQMLTIFPEGGIVSDREMPRLKPGLARLALQAEANQPGLGIRILPVSIRYGELPVRWRCGVRIDIGQPIVVSDFCQDPTKRAASQLTEKLHMALEYLYLSER